MKAKTILMLAAAASLAVSALADKAMEATIGHTSPNFTLEDSNGHKVSLNAQRGKFVVLEWTNKDCPFVRKHYNSGNMQATQEKARNLGAEWYTIISSASGEQGYLTPSEVNSYRTEHHVHSNATLFDSKGSVGHMYGARTTPQIVIIDPKGTVIYNGAIDDRPTPDPASLKGARNYVIEALELAVAGHSVAVSTSRPYGCSIKYGD